MDWVLVLLVLTSGGGGPVSHSHVIVNFASEKLCRDAAESYKAEFSKPSETGVKVDARAVCLLRKDSKGKSGNVE
jgi:hypothetical protein